MLIRIACAASAAAMLVALSSPVLAGTTSVAKKNVSAYVHQQQEYAQKAAEARAEAQCRSQYPYGLYAKYPRPAEVSKARADYFQWKSDQLTKTIETLTAQQ
jgi:hypothetical protein